MPETANLSYRYLRQTIGWLGILLPLIVYVDARFVGDCDCLQDSISHYYFTVANSWFVGIFWGLGLVLIFYPNYEEKDVNNKKNYDGVLTFIAGICALVVSVFPTSSKSHDSCGMFDLVDSDLRVGVHYASAGIMLCIFVYMSICVFTKSSKTKAELKLPENRWKKRRNNIFIICGWLTFASIALIGICAILENKAPSFPLPIKYTYWLEVAALLPFGFAWIIKGGFAFTDEEDDESTLEWAGRKVGMKKVGALKGNS